MENTKTAQVPTQTIINPTINKPAEIISQLSSDQLMDALYWIWDAFERSAMEMFLIKQTYEDAVKNHLLTGNKITIGVRRNQWQSGAKRTLDSFILPENESEDLVKYFYHEVNSSLTIPIEVHIYDDVPCIISTNMIRYAYEEFQVPNPYDEFIKLYG